VKGDSKLKQISGTDDLVSNAIEKYADMVRRICFLYLRNQADVEDVFQEVFLKFMLNADSFENEQHEKAWICRVTYNQCKDLSKSFWRKKIVSIDDLEIPYEDKEDSNFMLTILNMPSHYKQILYLHFYEQMTIPEIATLLNQNTNTIYTQLRRAKTQIKNKLKGDCFNETF